MPSTPKRHRFLGLILFLTASLSGYAIACQQSCRLSFKELEY